MSSLKDLASLIMVPSLYKDGELHTVKPLADEDVILHPDATGNHDGNDGSTARSSSNFTFSRGSNLAATRVDVNGLIEKGRENLVTYSNNFNNWSKASGASVTSGQAGYDGSSDAWLATSVSNTQPYQVYKGWSTYGVLTFSVYAKANTGTIFNIDFAIPDNGYVRVDLSDGSVISESGSSTYIGSNVVSVGGGWYRISVTANVTNSAYIRAGLYQTAGSVYIQDAQVEQGLVATDYIETGASTAQAGILEDMPRLDYSGSCPALLLEPQRTNLLAYSEYLEGSGWNKSNAGTGSSPVISTNTNDTTSPEGEYNATKIVFDAGSGTTTGDLSLLEGVVALAAGTEASTSIWLKGKNGGEQLHMRGVANSAFQIITLTTEWQQFTTTENSSTTTDSLQFGIRQNVSGLGIINSSATIYAYGAQIEAGSYPTSYIPTYGSSVTRSSDSTGHIDVSSLGVTTGYTLFYELGDFNVSVASSWLAQGGTNGRAYEVYGTTAIIKTTSGDRYPFNHGLTGTGIKVAVNYDGTNINVFTNGTKRGTWEANKTIWDALTNLDMTLNNLQMVNWKQLLVFPTALTDSECIALTTL